MPEHPDFLFFDVGNVLLHFDHHVAARQLAALAGADPAQVYEQVFESGLELRAEAGEINAAQYCDAVRRVLGRDVPDDQIVLADAAIFRINLGVHSVVAHLKRSGYRLGLLSNTSQIHWDYYASGRYGLIPGAFDVHARSYDLKTLKPDAAIYERAAKLAGSPRRIFFVDDREEHVAGARAAGWDAVHYTTTTRLVMDLRERGVRVNW